MHTKNIADLAAMIMISAQETTPGHFFSTAAFASSIISKPSTLLFGAAVFSVFLPSSKIDASHPFSTKVTQCDKMRNITQAQIFNLHKSIHATYPNPAVMKLQTNEIGYSIFILDEVLFNNSEDNFLDVGLATPTIIISNLQLRITLANQSQQNKAKGCKCHPRNSCPRHCYQACVDCCAVGKTKP